MNTTHVVLRQVKDADGSRLLEASVTANGDVLIAGCDFGEGVERVFGVREYEWAWTIPSASLPSVLHALGATGNVLIALKERFSGDKATLLGPFLEANEIPTERWSRLGD